MKYLSFDIETTGTEHKNPSNILQLSGVVEDTSNPLPLLELPHFTIFIAHDRYAGEAYALHLNAWIFNELAKWEKTQWKPDAEKYQPKYPVMHAGTWADAFLSFLKNHFTGQVTMAGKNAAGFDMQFLPKHVQQKFRGRVIDPGSMFADFTKDTLPGLDQICAPLGMSHVTHDAYEDALKVIEVIRKHPRFPNLSV